jgi:hypothetical protein
MAISMKSGAIEPIFRGAASVIWRKTRISTMTASRFFTGILPLLEDDEHFFYVGKANLGLNNGITTQTGKLFTDFRDSPYR